MAIPPSSFVVMKSRRRCIRGSAGAAVALDGWLNRTTACNHLRPRSYGSPRAAVAIVRCAEPPAQAGLSQPQGSKEPGAGYHQEPESFTLQGLARHASSSRCTVIETRRPLRCVSSEAPSSPRLACQHCSPPAALSLRPAARCIACPARLLRPLAWRVIQSAPDLCHQARTMSAKDLLSDSVAMEDTLLKA